MSVEASVRATLDPEYRGILLAGDSSLSNELRWRGIRFRKKGHLLLVPFDQAEALLDVGFQWETLAARAVTNRRHVRLSAPEVIVRAREVASRGPSEARRVLGEHRWSRVLDDHQILNVAIMTIPRLWGGSIFDEQGTGKTPTTIAIFDVLMERGDVDVLLVVAPKSMMGEWPREVQRFSDNLYATVVVQGTRKDRSSAIRSGGDVIVANYEGVVSMLDDLALLAQRARVMLAVDESFFVKNPEASRSSALRTLREWCTCAYVLCGTPAPNRPDDVVAQFDLVDFGYAFNGIRLETDSDLAADQVRTVMDSRSVVVRSTKRDALPNLPSRSFHEVVIDMAPLQRAAYDAALRNLILDLRSVSDHEFSRNIAGFFERRATLLRICSDPSPVVPGYEELPGKVEALDALLDRLIRKEGEKIVLWSFYRASIKRLVRRYEGYGVVRIDGSVVDVGDRQIAVRRFQEDDSIRLFVGNPAAAGAGLTLHRARIAVYESLSNQAAHYMQSLDRIHRRGQDREVEYFTLLANDSLEPGEYRRLVEKAQRQSDLLGDPPDPAVTRQIMLEELLATHEVCRA